MINASNEGMKKTQHNRGLPTFKFPAITKKK